MKKRIVVGMAVLGVVLAVSLILFPVNTEARNIKVGIVDTYSGPAAVFGNDALNGFKLAVEEINKQGVLGGKIEFTTRDEKFKPDIALNMAKELVMRENVDVLAGTINSASALSRFPRQWPRPKRCLSLSGFPKARRLQENSDIDMFFPVLKIRPWQGRQAGPDSRRNLTRNYWIAGDDYEYGHAIADATWRYLKAFKPDVVKIGESWWKLGEPDLVPYLTSISAAKPDAVIFCTGGVSMTNCIKALKTTGIGCQNTFLVPYRHRSCCSEAPWSRGA